MSRLCPLVILLSALGCAGEPSSPVATERSVAAAPATAAARSLASATLARPRVASSCRAPTVATPLQGPTAHAERDLDLQFHWRTATICQELHALEHDAGFRPFENIVVEHGEGHRVLLLLPSLDGVISVARYRVELADVPDAELIAAVTLEKSARAQSDGVDFAVVVTEDGQPIDEAGASFTRLTPEEAQAGWHAVRRDLSAYRGKTVWISLASRETGARAGDWLLWADPRVVVKQAPELNVDLGAPQRDAARSVGSLPWSAANVFKAYSGFNEDKKETTGNARWVERAFPWLTTLRLFSSLGGNWGPTLAREYASQMGHNPTRDSRDERQWAEYYEFFRDGPQWQGVPIRERFSWDHFDALYARIAATGVRLHINMAGVPELFSGGAGHYKTYHYNEMPVVDETGWKTYVDEVFRHLSRQPWFERAEFSFFSEPNCRWVANDGSVKHFGYQGDAAQYARQYLWTWQAMKPYVASGQVHLGPFVVEPDPAIPAVDNLPEHLRLLREEFARSGEPLPPWSGFAFNIYETPQLSIDHFASYKIDDVRRVLAAELPGMDLPLRFDEVGIHPLIATAFADAGVAGFEGSRWAAAWHAEMLALLLDQRIATGSPWLFSEMMRPYASYALLSVASGAFASERTADGALAIVPARRRQDVPPPTAQVRLGSRSADRIGYVWSSGDEPGARLAIWQLPRFPASDARLDQEEKATPVHIRIPRCDAGRCTVTVLGYDDQGFTILPEAKAGTTAPLQLAAVPGLPMLRQVETSSSDDLRLGLRPGELYLVQMGEQDDARTSLRSPR